MLTCNLLPNPQNPQELALLYSKPRAATVVCRSDGVLWSLSRGAYKHVMHRLCAPHYVWRTLTGVEALAVLSASQLQIVAEAMEEVGGGG